MPTKWNVLQAVEEAREPLGLKGTSIAVLRAMVSFLRVDQIKDDRDEQHVCFASNAALAKRAHVSVQTVERHISKLVSLGLIERRTTGNGKRWARRDGQGNVTLAAGLCVLPLVRRHAELLGLAQAQAALIREVGLLRDRCAMALAQLKASLNDGTDISALVTKARNLMRRKSDPSALKDLLREICDANPVDTSQKTKGLRGSDPEIEGHKETNLNPLVEEQAKPSLHVTQKEMERAYPKLCASLRFAGTQQDCEQLMNDHAAFLGLGKTWTSAKTIGPAQSFMLLGYLLERCNTIANPQAYATSLMVRLKDGTIPWGSLLVRPKRGQMAA